jgi:hypothetical protein
MGQTEHWLRVSEKRVLRKILWPRREGVTHAGGN